MTTALSPVIASRLEKAAVDNGFDQEQPREGDSLGFASTQCPLRIWLGTFGDAVFLATFSQQNVARALGEYGTPMAAPLPKGALGGRTVTDIPSLHRLLRRAFQLSKTLPDELLRSFEKQTGSACSRARWKHVGTEVLRDHARGPCRAGRAVSMSAL